MSKEEKARYWWGVLYPENMKENWENEIGDIIQVPYCYVKHTLDKDTKSEHRKDHIHLILVWNGPTTYSSAFRVFEKLNANGKKAVNKIESVARIRNAYDYLIHDTETCKKLGKELYSSKDRIMGNNFDIGAYEQIGLEEELQMKLDLIFQIEKEGFYNMLDFTKFVQSNYDTSYVKLVLQNGSFFERYTKANYQIYDMQNKQKVSSYKEGKPERANERS